MMMIINIAVNFWFFGFGRRWIRHVCHEGITKRNELQKLGSLPNWLKDATIYWPAAILGHLSCIFSKGNTGFIFWSKYTRKLHNVQLSYILIFKTLKMQYIPMYIKKIYLRVIQTDRIKRFLQQMKRATKTHPGEKVGRKVSFI